MGHTIHDESRFRGSVRISAESSGHHIGYIHTIQFGKTAIIETFGVDRNFRRRGIGTALLETAEQTAAAHGASRIVRIGWFCESDSIAGWLSTVRLLKRRNYRNLGLLLVKRLPR